MHSSFNGTAFKYFDPISRKQTNLVNLAFPFCGNSHSLDLKRFDSYPLWNANFFPKNNLMLPVKNSRNVFI